MDYNVLEALTAITREKQIDRRIIIESLVAGLQSAAKKKLGAEANIDARVDGDTGEMVVEQVKTVVEEVDDPDIEISLEEAEIEFGDDVDIGDEVRWELPLDQFGRNAILVAKQILVQKVREAERTQIYDEYKDRVNEIIVGTIQQVDRGNVLVNLGRVEALLPYREQIRGEKLHQGKTVRAFIIEVLDNAKGPQIILSRSHPGFLKALFEQEVPEIQEKIVEIKAVAREPGTRSKIAVASNDDRVDAVGSCVGMKGSRVQAVTRELAGERIDIVPWSADPSVLISRALSPAEVNHIVLNHDRREATVVVTEDQLSKAIGKEGKNVRLAAKLTEWKIDLMSTREFSVRQRIAAEMSMELEEMTGVTPAVMQALQGVGIDRIDELARASQERLEKVDEIPAEELAALQATAQATLDELAMQVEKAVQEELAAIEADERTLFDESQWTEEGGAEAEAEDEPDEPVGMESVEIASADPFEDFDRKIDPEAAGGSEGEPEADAGSAESEDQDEDRLRTEAGVAGSVAGSEAGSEGESEAEPEPEPEPDGSSAGAGRDD
ncbi:MAG: transcription termination factor NusA [Candidatus Krumholzibacteriia bacterium]